MDVKQEGLGGLVNNKSRGKQDKPRHNIKLEKVDLPQHCDDNHDDNDNDDDEAENIKKISHKQGPPMKSEGDEDNHENEDEKESNNESCNGDGDEEEKGLKEEGDREEKAGEVKGGKKEAEDGAKSLQNTPINAASAPPTKKTKAQGGTKKRYSNAFKLMLISQVSAQPGQSVAAIARFYNMNESTVRTFIKQKDKIAAQVDKNEVGRKFSTNLPLEKMYTIIDHLYLTNWGAASSLSSKEGEEGSTYIPTNPAVISAHAELVRDLILKKHDDEPFLSESELTATKAFKASPQWARAYATSHKWTLSISQGGATDMETFKVFERMRHVREVFENYFPLLKKIIDMGQKHPFFDSFIDSTGAEHMTTDRFRVSCNGGVGGGVIAKAEGGDRKQHRLTQCRFRGLENQLCGIQSELAFYGDEYASALKSAEDALDCLRRAYGAPCSKRKRSDRPTREKQDGKFRRMRYTIETQLDIIAKVKEYGSCTTVADLFKISESTVRSIIRRDDQIMEKWEAQKALEENVLI